MFNLKQIKSNGVIIEARVEPWMANEASFDIRVDTVRKSIMWCSIGENTDEYGMYAKKARNKLCKMLNEAKQTNTKLPVCGYYNTH